MLLIKPDTNYCLKSKSELLTNIVADYIIFKNEEVSIFTERSIFGKMLKVSDTEIPNKRQLVLSKIERELDLGFTLIDIDSSIISLTFEMNNMDTPEHEHHIKYLKSKLKKRDPEIAFYLTSAIMGLSNISTEAIDRILSDSYKGIHPISEKFQTIIEFVSSPTEVNLQRTLKVFNEEDYSSMIYCISSLTDNTPAWVTNRFGEQLQDATFIKNLLRIALIILKTNSREEFIIHTLRDIIYN